MLDVLRRLTSVTIAFALSGSPAVIAACMTLCLPGSVAAKTQGGGAAHHGHDGAAHQVIAPAADREASPAPHAHHDAHAHHSAQATSTQTVIEHHHGIVEHQQGLVSVADDSPAPAPGASLSSSCDDCCPDANAVVAAAGAERASARLLSTPPPARVLASAALLITARDLFAPRPPLSPPAPPRSPLALRI
ncbi:MAG: hypothetical protein IT178_16230 [Acidobacteria bacterium]|nr:hypothetical protein [Acidobacteriota bacterium]